MRIDEHLRAPTAFESAFADAAQNVYDKRQPPWMYTILRLFKQTSAGGCGA